MPWQDIFNAELSKSMPGTWQETSLREKYLKQILAMKNLKIDKAGR